MALPLPPQDAQLVAEAREGSEDAFSALYERYFDGVHDFLTRLLRDRQEAADLTQDTFIRAFERIDMLEKPGSFKSWLFTIAHRQGLNRLARSKRAVVTSQLDISSEEAAVYALVDPDRSGDPERAAEAEAAARIIWAAAAGLDPKTYSVLDLHVRHGLESAEIADVLGVSKSNAYTMVSRMKKSFSSTLSTYLLMRNGKDDCVELAEILAAAETDDITPELRKAVDKHSKKCDICKENRKVLFLPLKMFAALAAAPVPAGLQAETWEAVKAAGAVGAVKAGATVTTSSEPVTRSDTPQPAVQLAPAAAGGWLERLTHSDLGLGAAAVLLAILLVGGAALLKPPSTQETQVLSGSVTTTLGSEPVSAVVDSTTTTVAESVVTSSTTTSTLPPPVASTSTSTTTTTLPGTDPPEALVVRGDSFTVSEDRSALVNVLGNDSGVAAGAAPTVVDQPDHGTARVSRSSIFYAPDANFHGTDRFSYSVRGADGTTQTAQVAVSITSVNDAPKVPGPGTLRIDEDTTVRFDPLAGAADIDGDSLSLVDFDRSTANGGTITSGSLIYTPRRNWSGIDKFTYTVSDGKTEVEVDVTVSVAAVNDLPTGPALRITTEEDVSVTVNLLTGWSDADGDRVRLSRTGVFTTKAGGSVLLQESGIVIYTPPGNYSGSDEFGVRITDGTASLERTVRVDVEDFNDPPVVSNASFTTAESSPRGTVLGVVAASDPEGEALTFETLGSSVMGIDQTGTVTLERSLDFEQRTIHRLEVRVTDERGASADLSVVLTVTDTNEAPTVGDYSFAVDISAPADAVVGTVKATDPEGRSVSYSLQNAGGLVRIGATSGVITLRQAVQPAVFPITVTVVATDPAGNVGMGSAVIRVEDGAGPAISNFRSNVDSFYEPPPGGGVCTERPRAATFTADIADPSGIERADLIWRITVDGVESTGSVRFQFIDDRWEADLTMPAGVLTDGNPGTVFAKLRARDKLGNASTTGELALTVLPCRTD